jgi:hypothetical protein
LNRVQLLKRGLNPQFLLHLADYLLKPFSGAKVTANGDIELARPGVLGRGTALEEHACPARGISPNEPEVKGTMPIAIPMDGGTRLGNAG